jgi:hypothetical protein
MANTTDCIVVTNNDSIYTIFDVGDVFGIIPDTGSTGDQTATVELFGYLF